MDEWEGENRSGMEEDRWTDTRFDEWMGGRITGKWEEDRWTDTG